MPPKSAAASPDAKKEATVLKVVLIGEAASGKTQLMGRYVNDKYTASYISTIGIDFNSKRITLDGSQKQFKLQIWDTAGQERFKTITRSHLCNAHSIVVCCDAEKLLDEKSRDASLQSVEQHIQMARDHAPGDTPIFLVVTKADKAKGKESNIRDILTTQEKHKDKHISLLEPFTSAQDNEGIAEAFNAIAPQAARVAEQRAQLQIERSEINTGGGVLSGKQQQTGPQNAKLQEAQRKMDEVAGVMRDNIEKAIDRADHRDQLQEDASKLHEQHARSWIDSPRQRPGHALLALLIGIGLILLCVPPIAPIALPALGLGMLVMKTAGMIALEAAAAGFFGTILSFLLFRFAGSLKLGMYFREALRYLEIGIRAVISFFTVLIPGAAAFFLGVKLMGAAMDEMSSWKTAPLAILKFVFGAMITFVFGTLRMIFIGTFFLAGGLLQALAFVGGLFAKPIEWLDKNQIDLKQWSLWKAGLQWILVLPLIPFFLLKKVGTLLFDMADRAWNKISLLDDEFDTDVLIADTFFGALRLSSWEAETVKNLRAHDQLSIDDKETLDCPSPKSLIRCLSLNKSNQEAQNQNIFRARGFWPVPMDIAQATISKDFYSPEGSSENAFRV